MLKKISTDLLANKFGVKKQQKSSDCGIVQFLLYFQHSVLSGSQLITHVQKAGIK